MKLVFVGLFFVISIDIIGQVSLQRWVIGSWGNSHVNNGIYLSQTAGQPSNTAKFQNKVILSQGFQQAYSRSAQLTLDDDKPITCEIYPNPFVNYLHIKLNRWEQGLGLQLLTPQGKVVRSFSLTTTYYLLGVENLPFGLYLVVLTRNNKPIAIQRVVKMTH